MAKNNEIRNWLRWANVAGTAGVVAAVLTIWQFWDPHARQWLMLVLSRAYPLPGWVAALASAALVVLVAGIMMISARARTAAGVAGVASMVAYRERSMSDEHMLQDLESCTAVTFLGISQSSLPEYLRDYLKRSGSAPPLEDLRIIYAADGDGRLWEGDSFDQNLRMSRQNVAVIMTDESLTSHLRDYRGIAFLQNQHHSSFGGCLIRFKDARGQVLYVAHYLPASTPDTKETLTLRIGPNTIAGSAAHVMAAAYSRAYRTLIDSAKHLGRFEPTVWDRSATAWGEFVQKCTAYHESMHRLFNLANIPRDARVLDVGAGTGHTSKILRDALSARKLTVLDGSPQMMKHAKAVLGDKVHYALCRVPPRWNENVVDLRARYDAIVIHLALPAVAATTDELRHLAVWCRQWLTDTGLVALGAHNTAVLIESDPYVPEADPLRKAIADVSREMNLRNFYRELKRERFQRQEIEEVFLSAGYSLRSFEDARFDMTMDDRLRMWSAPAVLNDVLDVSSLGVETIRALLDQIHDRVGDLQTPDLAVRYWIFAPAPRVLQTREGGA